MDDFVKNANRQAMQEAVIAAMIESLDDQYSQYIPPSLESDFTKELSGDYAGIGARIENRGRAYKTKPLKIMTPMRGSPSLAAGAVRAMRYWRLMAGRRSDNSRTTALIDYWVHPVPKSRSCFATRW